jgi:DNA-nicking Smr family endonuclease
MGIPTNPDDNGTHAEAAHNGCRTRKRRKGGKPKYTSGAGDILTLDLHGCQTHIAVTRALQTLATRLVNVRKVNLIIGQGTHSKDSASRLRPALLDAL